MKEAEGIHESRALSARLLKSGDALSHITVIDIYRIDLRKALQRRACLAALADFAEQNADALDEIDLNPIKALPQGRGCVVVDALIVAKGATRG